MSLEQKRIDATKPYDSKTACWVPDEKEGFVQGKIIDASNDKTTKVQLPSFEVSSAAVGPEGIRSQLTGAVILGEEVMQISCRVV